MTLDSFTLEDRNSLPEKSGALSQFGQALAYEAQQQLNGLAQLDNRVLAFAEKPDAPENFMQQNAQLFGRAIADAIPMIVTGLVTRGAFGKLGLTRMESAELNPYLKRSVLGLSIAESATTGLITGTLLKPSDKDALGDTNSFIADRLKSGLASGLSFAALTGVNIGTAATTEKLGLTLLSHPIANALVAGVPGGFITAQIDSLSTQHRFTTDGAAIGQSIYDMTLLGAGFSAISAISRTPHFSNNPEVKEQGDRARADSNFPLTASPGGEALSSISIENFSKPRAFGLIAAEPIGAPGATKPNAGENLATTGSATSSSAAPELVIFPQGTLKINLNDSAYPLQHTSSLDGGKNTQVKESVDFRQILGRGRDRVEAQSNGETADEALIESQRLAQTDDRESISAAHKKAAKNIQKFLPYFIEDPAGARELTASTPFYLHQELVDFLQENPVRHKAVVQDELALNGKISTVSGLRGLLKLTERFGTESEASKYLRGFENKSNLFFLSEFISEKPETRASWVKNLLDSGQPAQAIDHKLLSALETLGNALGPDSPAMQRINTYNTEYHRSLVNRSAPSTATSGTTRSGIQRRTGGRKWK